MHTHTIQIDRPSGDPPPADAPHCRCQLPVQTLKLRKSKSCLKLRIFQQPGYQDHGGSILIILQQLKPYQF